MNDDPNRNDQGAGAPDPATQGAGGEGDQDSFFLEVDDRTRYRTSEDAVKGFREAGERIAGLTPYEKIAQEYGIEDPNELPELLDELATLRTKAEGAGKPPGDEPGDRGKAAPAAADDSGLSDEDRAGLAWAKKVGLVTSGDFKTQLTEVAAKVEELNKGRQTEEESRMASMIEEGRAYVPDLLKQHELPADDKKFVLRVERHIRAYLEDEGLRNGEVLKGGALERFYRGGRSQQAVLDEAFQDFLETYKFSASRKDANYADAKNNAQKGSPKPLPKGGIPGGADGPKAPTTFADAHKNAWDVYQQKLGHGKES